MRVLSVEDEPNYQFLIKEVLRDTPVDMHFASTLEKGIEKAKELNPDVILLDLALPPHRPNETLEAIPRFGNAAIVILSGSQNPKHMHLAFKMGADSYLQKEIIANPERMYSVIYNAFMRKTYKPSYLRNANV